MDLEAELLPSDDVHSSLPRISAQVNWSICSNSLSFASRAKILKHDHDHDHSFRNDGLDMRGNKKKEHDHDNDDIFKQRNSILLASIRYSTENLNKFYLQRNQTCQHIPRRQKFLLPWRTCQLCRAQQLILPGHQLWRESLLSFWDSYHLRGFTEFKLVDFIVHGIGIFIHLKYCQPQARLKPKRCFIFTL